MERPTTTLTKSDRNGWEAKSIIPLPGVIEKDVMSCDTPGLAQLEITTGKQYNGGLRASATVVYKTDYGFRHAISFVGAGDYSRPVKTNPLARCTEKSVRELHEASLDYLDTILLDVANHYGVNPLGELAQAA